MSGSILISATDHVFANQSSSNGTAARLNQTDHPNDGAADGDGVVRLAKLIGDDDFSKIFMTAIIVIPFTSFFGVIVNILNIIVYKRHGLQESIILGFFTLSIVDLIQMVCLFISAICSAVYVVYPHSNIDFMSIQVMSVGNLREMAFFYSNVLTALLTIERCCCVIFPFRVKVIFSIQRSRIVIIALFVFVLLGFAPVWASAQIRWMTFPIPGTNETIGVLTQWYPPYRTKIYYFSFTVMAIPVPTLALLLIIINTIIMANGLRASSKFRKTTTSVNSDQSSSSKDTGMSSRDTRLVKVMVLLGSILTVCNLPYLVFIYVQFFEPELDFGMAYHNMFNTAYFFCYVFSSANASANIFVYYRNSTRFRQIFDERFGNPSCAKKKKSGNGSGCCGCFAPGLKRKE